MVETGKKVMVKLNWALFAMSDHDKQCILNEASHQLHREITWDDVEDYNITLEAELSLF